MAVCGSVFIICYTKSSGVYMFESLQCHKSSPDDGGFPWSLGDGFASVDVAACETRRAEYRNGKPYEVEYALHRRWQSL